MKMLIAKFAESFRGLFSWLTLLITIFYRMGFFTLVLIAKDRLISVALIMISSFQMSVTSVPSATEWILYQIMPQNPRTQMVNPYLAWIACRNGPIGTLNGPTNPKCFMFEPAYVRKALILNRSKDSLLTWYLVPFLSIPFFDKNILTGSSSTILNSDPVASLRTWSCLFNSDTSSILVLLNCRARIWRTLFSIEPNCLFDAKISNISKNTS